MPSKKKYTKRIELLVSQEVFDYLTLMADVTNTDRNSFIRSLIKRGMEAIVKNGSIN